MLNTEERRIFAHIEEWSRDEDQANTIWLDTLMSDSDAETFREALNAYFMVARTTATPGPRKDRP